MARDLADGLAWIHHAGVLHRDISPQAVVIDSGGRARLMDIGIALPVYKPAVAPGTPAYMAPELWNEDEPSTQTDIYALAATMFEALAGTPPFHARRLAALRARHLRSPIPDAGLPAAARGLMFTGLAKSPGDRPATSAAFRDAITADAERQLGPDWAVRGRAELATLSLVCCARYPSAVISGMSGEGTGLGAAGAASTMGSVRTGIQARRRALLVLPVVAVLGGVLLVSAHHPATALPAAVVAPAATPTPAAPAPKVLANAGPAVVPTPKPTPRPTATPTATPKPTPRPSPSAIQFFTPTAPPPPPPTPTPTPTPIGSTFPITP